MGLAWKYTTNVAQYGKPTGVLIAGRCNWKDPAFASARAKGAEVLVYIAPTERPDHRVCDLDMQFYKNNLGAVPLWPYPTYGQRSGWPNTRMTDMRPGSQWIQYVVSYVEKLMREKKVDGVYLDSVGARRWGRLANWESWPQSEKNTWTDGNIDLVRRLDAKRRAINPDFIIVNNNTWDRGDSRGFAAEKYIDGINLEHPTTSNYHKKYVGRQFSNLGHRRVFVTANNRSEALMWAKVPGVTHVSDQTSSQYKHPNPPVVGFTRLNDR
jgi:hypothetical protein